MRGKGFLALSNKHNIPATTLRGWYGKRSELEAELRSKNIEVRSRRQLDGSEESLQWWILKQSFYQGLEREFKMDC